MDLEQARKAVSASNCDSGVDDYLRRLAAVVADLAGPYNGTLASYRRSIAQKIADPPEVEAKRGS